MNSEKFDKISKLKDAFIRSVITYSELMLKDSTAANRYYELYGRALKQLASLGDDGLSGLAGLLDDKRSVVRVTAACYLMHYRTAKATDVLVAATKSNRGIALLALATLKRWEKGIYLDPKTGKEVSRFIKGKHPV